MALEEPHADSRLRCIPVIVLCRSSADSDIDYAYEHCASSYVTKPVNLDEFASVMQRLQYFWLGVAQLPPYTHRDWPVWPIPNRPFC
jgi:CheY-like chemotaxis protein